MANIKKPKTHAFTLVELIVVIVILAILATIAFLSFSSQSGSARDSTRLSDISSIKKSVEMYNVNAWTYPTPDYAYSYTYSWGIIWNQWTIWDSAYKMLQKNLSKKVVDPLKWSEYDYSLASNKREYQVAWNFENPTSFERNYNPFDSSVLSPKLSALGWTGANVYISWNYNWVMLKVFTWSTYYFVPTPTLFWIWTWSTVYDNTFWSWKDLLPWVNNVAVFDSSKVYASTSSTWLTAAEVESLMVTIQSAYLTWNVTTPAVQEVLAATWSALTDLWTGLVKNSLGWWVTSSSSTSVTADTSWASSWSAGTSCKTIKESYPTTTDWVYWIKPDANPAIQTYCDMTTDWGGWTKIMHANFSNFFTTSNYTLLNENTANNASLYSIINRLDSFKDWNKYTFRFQIWRTWDTTSYKTSMSNYTIWSQNHNPFISSTDWSDFIFLDWEKTSTCWWFNWLHYKTPTNSIASDADQNDDPACWWIQAVPIAQYYANKYLDWYWWTNHFHDWQILWVR
ncbi:MAG: hypothetical protein ACD_2C00205G0003 [uncultured bacterium (gcode 4)]|uniref:Fibrinogen C-terminal domain-containing protein n=1 Tax=uncultured bacterium (gcode 4) TaxID=1234023 RepID=K2H0D1_9BACT|nr:MAG: hypothetical protein ACD_2C00205G0003 [uncultured bacterium (gcode 4)]